MEKVFNFRVTIKKKFPFIKITLGLGSLDSPLRNKENKGKVFTVRIFDQHYELLDTRHWTEHGRDWKKFRAGQHVTVHKKRGLVDLLAQKWDDWEMDGDELILNIVVYDPEADTTPTNNLIETYNSWEHLYGSTTKSYYEDDEIIINTI